MGIHMRCKLECPKGSTTWEI